MLYCNTIYYTILYVIILYYIISAAALGEVWRRHLLARDALGVGRRGTGALSGYSRGYRSALHMQNAII